jgi:hypothetical protein
VEWRLGVSQTVNDRFINKKGMGLGLSNGPGKRVCLFRFGILVFVNILDPFGFVRFLSPRTFYVKFEFPGTELVIIPNFIKKDFSCHIRIIQGP